MTIDQKSRLIVALDFPNVDEARALVDNLGSSVSFYKIGLELLFRGGMQLAEDLKSTGNNVFIDAKLLDISNTVEKSVANIAATGADFLTIHGIDKKTIEAAVKGRGNSNLKLLAVTVMTHLDQNDLDQQGTTIPVQDLVIRRASFASECGCDGVVASGLEAEPIRKHVGQELKIVTPGIRPKNAEIGDQTRVMTPEKAIAAGADYLVVGRPISQATDPAKAAKAIQEEIANALNK